MVKKTDVRIPGSFPNLCILAKQIYGYVYIVHISKPCESRIEPCSHQRRSLDANTRTHSPAQQSHSLIGNACQFASIKGVLTFFGCASSSTGYHFWAFWLGCGTVLSPFPNCFVWPTVESDILAAGDEVCWKRKKEGGGGCRQWWLLN